MFVPRARLIRSLCAALVGIATPAAIAQTPLDVFDPTPRDVLVQANVSFIATYSASGNTGTLVIPVAAHEQMRSGFLDPVPTTFTPITIDIDLTTFEATSSPASGAMSSGPISLSFATGVLDTTALAGFMGPSVPPLFCTSQAEVDAFCMVVPLFCGQVCTIVPGVNYNGSTGEVQLVGSESQQGCDGAVCSGPFTYFSDLDLQLFEAPELGMADSPTVPMLAGILLLCAARIIARRHRSGNRCANSGTL